MNKTLTFSIAVFLGTSVFISGCKKFVHHNIQAASNSSVAINAFNDVFEQLNAAVDSSLDAKTTASWTMNGTLCTDVTLSSLGSSFPKILTIDYGNECVGIDGVLRSGKIIAVFSSNLESEEAVVTVSFEDYRNGQYTVAGTDSIVNTGVNGNGKPTFKHFVENGIISWDTQEIKWESELIRTWTEGESTNFSTDLSIEGLTDDVFELTGTAVGNDSNTHPFTLETSESIVVKTECQWITGGMLSVNPANYNAGTVDYGIGDCDQQATIEVDGEVFNFTL